MVSHIASPEEFRRAIDGTALVDFWADWCGPCKMMAPIFEELSEAYAGRIRFFKLDVDALPEIPGELGISGIPTLILFRQGGEAARLVGAVPKARLAAWLDGHLAQ